MAISEIGVDELAARLEAGARLVDVREADEFEHGHVAGATWVPLGSVPDRIDELAALGTVHVICHVGGRSLRACEHLAAHGIDAVNVAGGMVAWSLAGHDVVTGPA